MEQFPDIPLEQVPGNCDCRPGELAEKLLILREKRILLCHGHTYGVKQSLLNAGYAAEEQALGSVSLRSHPPPAGGHAGPDLFLNPGSIGDYARPFYGVVTIENGRLDGRTVPLD